MDFPHPYLFSKSSILILRLANKQKKKKKKCFWKNNNNWFKYPYVVDIKQEGHTERAKIEDFLFDTHLCLEGDRLTAIRGSLISQHMGEYI